MGRKTQCLAAETVGQVPCSLQIRYLIHRSWFNGAQKRGSMPYQGPYSECVHCNNMMLAACKHDASALFWYAQRYHDPSIV